MQDPAIKKKVEELVAENGGPLDGTFYYKFGTDGSKGHTQFKQAYNDGGDGRDKGACMASYMVPLQLTVMVNGRTELLYNNVLANASDACRPLRLWMVPETDRKLY